MFIANAGVSLALSGFPVHGFTQDLPRGKVAVIILEGGLDGLAAVPPVGDPSLEKMRSNLVSSKPIRLNPFFALSPALGGFGKMLADGEATIIHATSFPYTKRSHFEGQNIVQSGDMRPFSTTTGWLGRALDEAKLPGRALSIDMPLIVRGRTDLDNYYPASLRGSSEPDKEIASLLNAYHGPVIGEFFDKSAEKYTQGTKIFARDPVSLAKYAGNKMQSQYGPSAAVITINEFDTHANQGADGGSHYQQLSLLDDILLAFRVGLGDSWKDTVILTVTEFGRTVRANGSAGTDHGYGSVGLLAGGLLNGGKIVTKWPGINKNDLFEKRDLMSTIDYRSICAACVERAFGVSHDRIAYKVFNEPKLQRLYDHLFA